MKKILLPIIGILLYTISFSQPKSHNLLWKNKYEIVMAFHENLAAAKKNGKWGFVDKTGKIVIPLIYEDAGFFIKGYALVKQVGEFTHINNKGMKCVKPGDVALMDEGWEYECACNNIWYRTTDGEIQK